MDTMRCSETCDGTMVLFGATLDCDRCGRTVVRRDFEIPSPNLARLRERIAHLASRAKRLGVPAPTIAVGEPSPRKLEGGYVIDVYPVTVEGEAPRIAGWSFAATLDHGESGGDDVIVRSAGRPIPTMYRESGARCEHCGTRRERRSTYVLAHDDGRWTQVGSSCLADFLGHPDPTSIAAMAELLAEALDEADACSDDGGGFARPDGVVVETYLAWVAQSVRLFGWCSRAAATDRNPATATRTSDAMSEARHAAKQGRPFDAPTAEDKARGAAALAFARDLGEAGGELSDYEWNLRAACRRAIVTRKTEGLVASAIAAWDRQVARKRESATSEHFGVVGKRGDYTLTVERVIPCDGSYGTRYLHLLRDEGGNVAKWMSSGEVLDTGTTYRVRATVKAHDDYKGLRQTTLTRCQAKRLEAPIPVDGA